MLTYAFDLLTRIYEEEGYPPADIPRLILEKNLTGLELDRRAAALAAFALTMKARQYDRRFLRRGVTPHIVLLEPVALTDGEIEEYMQAVGLDTPPSPPRGGASQQAPQGGEQNPPRPPKGGSEYSNPIPPAGGVGGPLKPNTPPAPQGAEQKLKTNSPLWGVRGAFEATLRQFARADTFGALIRPHLTGPALRQTAAALTERGPLPDLFLHATHRRVLQILDYAEALSQRYHVVIANPPYMGNRGMNDDLRQFSQDQYPDSKSDLFALFIERNLELAQPGGLIGMITMQSWMFLSSFEKLRTKIVKKNCILTLAHFGPRAFDTIGGEIVSTTAFVVSNQPDPDFTATFLRLIDGRSEAEKASMLRQNIPVIGEPLPADCYHATATDFEKIPGVPIAYWASKKILSIFEANSGFGDYTTPAVGLNTGDNNRFLRLWNEVSYSDIQFGCKSIDETEVLPTNWVPYNKGGEFRKWYGNRFFVINWKDDGAELKEFAVLRNAGKHWSRYIQNLHWMFKEGVTWSATSSSYFGCRYTDSGFMFDVKGTSAFSDEIHPIVMAGFLTTKLVSHILGFLNPTIEFQTRDIRNLPFVREVTSNSDLSDICEACVNKTKSDWDAYETSWDFTTLPLLRPEHREHRRATLADTYAALRHHWQVL